MIHFSDEELRHVRGLLGAKIAELEHKQLVTTLDIVGQASRLNIMLALTPLRSALTTVEVEAKARKL